MARKKARTINPTPAGQKGVKTLFAQTECKLKIPPGHPGRKIPETKEEKSFFINLESGNAMDIEVFEALQKVKQVRSVLYRDDLRVVECICTTKEERDHLVGSDIPIQNKQPIRPLKPRHLVPRLLYIRLANLSVDVDESEVRQAIINHWSQYGDVIDAAPHKVKGTNWVTRRWDLLLTIEKTAQKLEAPVAFDLLGRNIVAAWPGSPPSCLACQSAGHQAKKCPSRKSKAGDAFDPERQSMSHPSYAETTKTGSDSSPVPQSQPQTSESARSGNADVKQKSTPGSTSQSGQGAKSGVYASIHNPSAQKTAAPGSDVAAVTETSEIGITEIEEDTRSLSPISQLASEVGRPSTPVSQISQSTAEQTTQRSEAGKRVMRYDAEKDMRDRLPTDVRIFLEAQKWCIICSFDHPEKECPERWKEPDADDVQNMVNWVRSYMEEHKKKNKRTTRSGSNRASSSTPTPMPVDSYAPQTRSTKKNKK